MRTTLDIDDDVLQAAKSLANKQSKSIGKVISELVRRAITPTDNPKIKNGVPLFNVKDSKEVVTFELINSLRALSGWLSANIADQANLTTTIQTKLIVGGQMLVLNLGQQQMP